MTWPDVQRTAVIVDSWPMVRIGLIKVLQSAGIRIVGETADGVEGLVRVRSEGAGLLVLGDQIGDPADLVRRAKHGAVAPVVALLIGQASRDDLTPLLTAGADALLVRSIGPDELTDAIRRLLKGERVVSPALLSSLVGLVGLGAEDTEGVLATRAGLTAKEREVLAGLAGGRSNHQIATGLFVSAATVKTHLNHIYGKLGVRSRHEAVARGVALGLLK